MLLTILHGSIKGRHDIFRRNKGLDVVHRGKHKAAAGRQIIDAAFHFIDHFLRLAEWQDMLGIDPAASSGNIARLSNW